MAVKVTDFQASHGDARFRSLTTEPAFYLSVLTHPSKPLTEEAWKSARGVRRPRSFRMTNLETAALASRRCWSAQKRERDANRVARSHLAVH